MWVARPPKPRDKTALQAAQAWLDYDELTKCSIVLYE